MTFYRADVSETLQAFVAELQLQVSGATFTEPLARRYWESVKDFSATSLQELQDALISIDLTTAERCELLMDAIELSRETLAWSEENQLAYADALAELGAVFLERLQYTGLLSSGHAGGIIGAETSVLSAIEAGTWVPMESWLGICYPQGQSGAVQRTIAPPVSPRREVWWNEIEYELMHQAQTGTPDSVRGFIVCG